MANIPRVTHWVPPPTRLQGDKLLKAKQAEARAKEAEDAANAVRVAAELEANGKQSTLEGDIAELKSLVNTIIKNVPRMMPAGGGGKRMVAKVLARDFPQLDSVSVDNLPGADSLDPVDLLELYQDGVKKKLTYEELLSKIREGIGEVPPSTGTPTYYFDAVGGSDSNNGRTAAAPFQSIGKLNSLQLLPSDQVFFKRGQTHNGAIVMPASGTAGHSILITAYGTGAAPVIASGAASGFNALNREYFTLDGLEFLGGVVGTDDIRVANAVDGILIENAQVGDTKLAGVNVVNCTIHEYGFTGIYLKGSNAASGFAAPFLDNNTVYACTHNTSGGSHSSGIMVCADAGFGAATNGYAHTGVTIRSCTVRDNLGTLGDTDWNGSGIFVGQTDGASITNCIAFNNGQNSNYVDGPFGIWSEDSNAVITQNCESYLNRIGAAVQDGGGFCIGTGSTNCVYERCYSHANRGNGFKMYAGAQADIKPWDTNTIRFCITDSDHTFAFDLGGSLAVIADANMINVRVHNNTIYQNGGSPRNCLMLRSTTGVLITDFEGYITNNIIYARNTAALIQADGMNTTFMRLRGNDYFSAGTFLIEWAGSDYATFAAWQAANSTQEKISAVNVGLLLDPILTNPAGGGTINAVNSLLTGFKLQSASPMIGAGRDILTDFSFSPGTLDFYGNPIGSPFTLGASYGTLNVALTITGAPVQDGVVGDAYTGFVAAAAGGVPPYVYSKIGTWPAGLALNTSSGAVTGTPTTAGVYASLYVRVTDAATAVANLGPFTVTVTESPIVIDPLAPNIPQGTDNEAIIHTLTSGLSNPVYSIIANGQGMSIVGSDIILSDKSLFFAQAQAHVTVRATSGASTADQVLNFNIVPGYYDVGVLGNNVGMHWDFADQGTYWTDDDDTYIQMLKDKSGYTRHLKNPWFLDRRPRLANPSTLKSTLRAMRNITWAASGLFGLANPETPIWHGIRYVLMTSTSIALTAAHSPNNNDKTLFSGIPSLLGRNLMVVIYGDATTCTLRIDGVTVQTKSVGAGYFPPQNPFLIAFTCRLISAGTMLAPNHLGQHPFWENGSFNGDVAEFVQLFNVSAV